MASNGKPQFLRHVFSQQSNGAAGEAVNAAVRQDKARIASARPATIQPAAVTPVSRAKPVHPNGTRATNGNVAKTTTVHLDLWVSPIVKAELKRIAEQEGLSMSATGAALLEAAIRQKLHIQQGVLIAPVIKQAIRDQMQGISNRLAFLLARNAFSAEQTRAIAANILGRQSGMTEEQLKHILAMTKRDAQGNLTRRNPEFEELIAAVKQWLDEAETENHPPQATDAIAGVSTTDPSH
jgi:hypothetical protein